MAESDKSRVKHGLNLFLEFGLLAVWVSIWFNYDWFGIRGEVDMVGNWTDWRELGWFAENMLELIQEGGQGCGWRTVI